MPTFTPVRGVILGLAVVVFGTAMITIGGIMARHADTPNSDGVTITHHQEYSVTVGSETYDTGCAGHGFRIFDIRGSKDFFVVPDPSCGQEPR